ncbi:MAG: hypothetical protein RLY20_2212, partial [Verrucomicrobiota bacterium]
MASKIQIKRSNVAAKVPTAADLDVGELAVNFPDKKLFTKEPGGTVIALAEDADAAHKSTTNTFTQHQVIEVTDNANPALRVTQKGTGDALRVEDEANPDATPFVIGGSGNVGIGTTPTGTPKLEVAGKAWFQGSPAGGAVLEIAPDVAGGANGITVSASFLSGTYGPLYFKTSNQNRLTITKDGEFGIGGSHGAGIGAIIHARHAGGISAAFTDDVNSTLNIRHESTGLITFDGPGASNFRWVTNGTEAMRISTNGFLSVGRTNFNANVQGFYVGPGGMAMEIVPGGVNYFNIV